MSSIIIIINEHQQLVINHALYNVGYTTKHLDYITEVAKGHSLKPDMRKRKHPTLHLPIASYISLTIIQPQIKRYILLTQFPNSTS